MKAAATADHTRITLKGKLATVGANMTRSVLDDLIDTLNRARDRHVTEEAS